MSIRNARRLGALLLATSVVGLSACGGVDRNFVAREWALTVRQYNMVPVFPLREDIQVGDIYLLPKSPVEMDKQVRDGKDFLAISVLYDSIDLTGQLDTFMKTRLVLPRISDPDGFGADGDVVTVPECNGLDGCLFQKVSQVTSLRQVALPDVHLATFTGAEAQAIVPGSALAAAVGMSYESVHSVTLKVPAAESYGLPAAATMAHLFRPHSTDANKVVACFDARGAVEMVRRRQPDAHWAYLQIPTEIFVARAVDMEVRFSRSGGFGASAVLPTPEGEAGALLKGLLGDLSGVPEPEEATDVPGDIPNGTPPNGTVPNGAAPNGAAPNGTAPNGTAPNGAAPNGTPDSSTPAATPQTPQPRSDIPVDIAIRAAELKGRLETLQAGGHSPGGALQILSASQGGVTLRRTFQRPLAIGFRAFNIALAMDGKWESVTTGCSPKPLSNLMYAIDRKDIGYSVSDGVGTLDAPDQAAGAAGADQPSDEQQSVPPPATRTGDARTGDARTGDARTGDAIREVPRNPPPRPRPPPDLNGSQAPMSPPDPPPALF